MCKGIMHVHSTYSDGELSLPQLVQFFKKHGFNFLCITDHHTDPSGPHHLTGQQYEQLVQECHAVSSQEFVCIPGLEFATDQDLDILGIGLTEIIQKWDIQSLVPEIRKQGGIAILSHPSRNDFSFDMRSVSQRVDGAEIYNSHDFIHALDRKTYREWRYWRKQKRPFLTTVGFDFHQEADIGDCSMHIPEADISTQAILDAIKTQKCVYEIQGHRFRTLDELPRKMRMTHLLKSSCFYTSRTILKKIQSILTKYRIPIPQCLLNIGKIIYYRRNHSLKQL